MIHKEIQSIKQMRSAIRTKIFRAEYDDVGTSALIALNAKLEAIDSVLSILGVE